MGLQKKVKWLFGLIVAANFVLVLMVVLGALEPKPSKPLPNPNGYDTFVKAGNLLTGKAYDFFKMEPAALTAFVATNAEALKLFRTGLPLQCRTPNDYDSNYFRKTTSDYPSLKDVALNLAAEGRLATLQGRTNDAVQSYLDAIRLGVECCRGGVMMTKLVGIACESLGCEPLRHLLEKLDSSNCRYVARTLEAIDADESSLNETLEEERAWMRRMASVRDKIEALFDYKQQRKDKADFASKFQANQRSRRQMMLDAAARAYQLEKGKPPAAANDLVPEYLRSIPQDPVSSSNLVFGANPPP